MVHIRDAMLSGCELLQWLKESEWVQQFDKLSYIGEQGILKAKH